MCIMGVLQMDVSAEEGIVFHVKNQTGKAGDAVTVPVELHSGEQVGGFDIKVYYDPESMEFQELQKGELIRDDGLFDYNHKTDEAAVKIVYVVSDTIEADGTIANLVFKLKRDCESLPVGMGLKEVIDGSEEGNELAGQVTGTDPAYQEQAERRVAEENPAAEENRAEVQEEEGAGEEIQEEDRKEQNQGGKVQEKEADKENQENLEENSSEGTEKEKTNSIGFVLIGVAVIAGVVIWRGKLRKSR